MTEVGVPDGGQDVGTDLREDNRGLQKDHTTEAIAATKDKEPPDRRKMTLMEAHRLLGHNRDWKAIKKFCESNNITLTDMKKTQCLSCDANNLKDYTHSGTINRHKDAWSVDIKVNGAPADMCKLNSAILFVNNLTGQMHTRC